MLFIAKGEGSSPGYARATWHEGMLVIGELRPWADKAHISAQNIVELGKFIQFKAAEELSYASNSRIAGRRMSGPDGLRIFNHGAKFVDCEQTPVLPDTLLPKNDGPLGGEADGKSNEAECRAQKQ